jgi:hypothetical protein
MILEFGDVEDRWRDITDRWWEEEELNERVSYTENGLGKGREIALLNEQITTVL